MVGFLELPKRKDRNYRLIEGREVLTPTRDDIQQGQTSRGGWTKTTLAEWGIAWPPYSGWKRDLERLADRVYGVHK